MYVVLSLAITRTKSRSVDFLRYRLVKNLRYRFEITEVAVTWILDSAENERKREEKQGQSNDALEKGRAVRAERGIKEGRGRGGVQVIGSFGVKSLSPVPSLRSIERNPRRSINSSTRFRGEVEHAEGTLWAKGVSRESGA